MDGDQDRKTRGRAFQIWLDEGRPEGRAEAHWLQAEGELGGDRAAVAAESDYVMQIDETSRSATDEQLSNPEGPADAMTGSVAPHRSGTPAMTVDPDTIGNLTPPTDATVEIRKSAIFGSTPPESTPQSTERPNNREIENEMVEKPNQEGEPPRPATEPEDGTA